MEKLCLYSADTLNTTAVSNIFIDSYMPAANGSYVKVYLYLLRCLSGDIKDFSVSYLADRLEDSEKDIIRALKYWEKVQLISLSDSQNGSITSIRLNEPKAISDESEESMQAGMAASTETVHSVDNPDLSSSFSSDSSDIPQHPVYSNEQIAELSNNDEIKWTLNIIEQYLERPLKPKDIQLILYLYDSIGFSPELIMYLYEYCISKEKKNASYIEAVALSWAEQGISTVEEAETSNTLYNSNYTAVCKAMGLNRTVGSIEKKYIDKWIVKFGFSIDIIVEACSRALLNTQKADFKYTDKILENWSKHQVTKIADIKSLDSEFIASKNAKNAAVPAESAMQSKPLNNRFNAFPQRNYTKEDFEDIEKRLLSRQ